MNLEETRKLKVGDYVNLTPAKVVAVDRGGGGLPVKIELAGGMEYWVRPATLASVTERPFRVGDKVENISGDVFEVVAPIRKWSDDDEDEICLWSKDSGYCGRRPEGLKLVSD